MPKWKRDSEFGPGRRVPFDRERLAVFRAQLTLHRRPGRLTSTCVLIGQALAGMIGADGRLDPSVQSLAARVGVCRSTATRALARLRECGFLDWTRRLVRDVASGWRTEQASNAYELKLPACEAQKPPPVLFARLRKAWALPRREERGFQAELISPNEAQTAREALARVRQQRQTALATAYWAKQRARRASPALT